MSFLPPSTGFSSTPNLCEESRLGNTLVVSIIFVLTDEQAVPCLDVGQTVKEPRLPYPEKEKPLTLGLKYRWRVKPLKGDDDSADPIVDSKFLILTKYEIGLLANLKAHHLAAMPVLYRLA